MKAPRNEREFNARVQPVERVGIRFAVAIRPAPRRKRKPRTLWQRFLSAFK